jgi:hypothetical protein
MSYHFLTLHDQKHFLYETRAAHVKLTAALGHWHRMLEPRNGPRSYLTPKAIV